MILILLILFVIGNHYRALILEHRSRLQKAAEGELEDLSEGKVAPGGVLIPYNPGPCK